MAKITTGIRTAALLILFFSLVSLSNTAASEAVREAKSWVFPGGAKITEGLILSDDNRRAVFLTYPMGSSKIFASCNFGPPGDDGEPDGGGTVVIPNTAPHHIAQGATAELRIRNAGGQSIATIKGRRPNPYFPVQRGDVPVADRVFLSRADTIRLLQLLSKVRLGDSARLQVTDAIGPGPEAVFYPVGIQASFYKEESRPLAEPLAAMVAACK